MLNTPALELGIMNLLTEMRTKTENADQFFAAKMANLIEEYVKSATVTVAAGIAVTTNTGAGATTTPGTGTIS